MEFLSILIFPDGSIRCDPQNTDSHDALIDYHDLPDDNLFIRKYVRAKYKVDHVDDLPDISKYKLVLCEEYEPIWLEDILTSAIRNCRSLINRMIVSDKRKILLGGCWIIVKGAHIGRVLNSRIIYMNGGIIKYFRGGSLENYKSGVVKNRIPNENNES